MGKSYRKHDIIGHGSGSEKKDKRIANRTLRHRVKMALNVDPEIETLPIMREVSDVWCMSKDGKSYFGDLLKGNGSRFPHNKRSDDPFWVKVYRDMKGK